jgi:hypothetical protein
MRRALGTCMALLLTTQLGTPPQATAAENLRTCWSATEKNEGYYQGSLNWTYLHTVRWCGNGTSVTFVTQPAVDVDVQDKHCTWQGVTEAWSDTPGAASARTFSVGKVACTADDTTTRGMNPWVILTVHADGTYDTEMGIA